MTLRNSICAIIIFATALAAAAAPENGLAARLEEIAAKDARIKSLLDAQGLDGVLIATQRNFAWATAGGDNHVVHFGEEGSASLLWLRGKKYIIAPNNEIARIAAEEVAGLGCEPVVYNWFDDAATGARAEAIRKLTAGCKIGADVNFPGAKQIGGEVAALRATLLENELERYRRLGRITAEIVEQTCREITPGETEGQIQGRLLGRLTAQNINSSVVLVAADERIENYKHAITKTAAVRRHAIISVCAKKWGLVVAVTRAVHFGELPDEMSARQRSLASIYTQMFAATKPGARAADIFTTTRAAYAAAGYPDGWQAHHLGGAIGYQERDYKIFPGCPQIVRDQQAFAWNPTLPGVKIEETFVAYADRIEFLTQTGDWPCATVDVNGRKMKIPQILIR